MGLEIEFQNLEKVVNDIQKYLQKDKEAVKKGMVDTGFAIQKEASILCPVDTGRLRSSIAVATSKDVVANAMNKEDVIDKPSNEFEVWVGTRVFYAPYVEFGTKKMRPRPYLRPAFQKWIVKLTDFILREMEK
ncbi:MAG: HK97 gp10 family phage protein [Candidatus Micrarchaeia archaeon]